VKGGRTGAAVVAAHAALLGALHLVEASRGELVVQDDARQHVTWMQSLRDPALLRGDLVSDYFRSVSPAGFRGLYAAACALGVEPFTFARALPAALTLVTALLAYRLVLRHEGRPVLAVAAACALGQVLWLTDALANATPRAFAPPLLLAFLLAASAPRARAATTAAAVLALGLVYPQAMLVAAGALALRALAPPLEGRRRDALPGLAVAGAVLAAHLASVSPYGPVLTLAEARELPALAAGGRSAYFSASGEVPLLEGARSGLVPLELSELRARLAPAVPPWAFALAGLAALAAPAVLRRPLGRVGPRCRAGERLALELAVSAVACFGLAHLVAFRLHLPSRYAQHPLRVLFALSLGITAGALLERVRSRAGAGGGRRALAALLGAGGVALSVAGFGAGWHGQVRSAAPAMHRFLRGLPPGAVVATLEPEGADVGAFAARISLFSREHLVPYHRGYARALEAREADLRELLAATSPARVRALVERHGIDVLLVRALPAGGAVARGAARCALARDGDLAALDAACLAAGAGDG
jgi:hypothetical protein